jgi:hypothetical protein
MTRPICWHDFPEVSRRVIDPKDFLTVAELGRA